MTEILYLDTFAVCTNFLRTLLVTLSCTWKVNIFAARYLQEKYHTLTHTFTVGVAKLKGRGNRKIIKEKVWRIIFLSLPLSVTSQCSCCSLAVSLCCERTIHCYLHDTSHVSFVMCLRIVCANFFCRICFQGFKYLLLRGDMYVKSSMTCCLLAF